MTSPVSITDDRYAVAIDLGTTTLAASLVDTKGKKRLATCGSLNPQRTFGSDVISRLQAAVESEQALQEMSRLVRVSLWQLFEELIRSCGISSHKIPSIAIAGNPAMQHILLGLPVDRLAAPPYRPLFTEGRHLKAEELAWASDASVYLFPMPGGFVGGDTVAFVYGHQSGKKRQGKEANRSLLIDMGTNGEMALVADDAIWATSAAAGPAFEGGNLSCGMAALPGAINSLHFEEGRLKLKVIQDAEPAGICGSAAIEAVSQLLTAQVIDSSGRLRDGAEIGSNLANRIIKQDGQNSFVIYRAANKLLLLTQEDIRQIQLAKGALKAGLDVLLERSRIHCQDLQEVVLTGSFGAVLAPDWLKRIGILDEAMLQITRFTPEGALDGVEQALFANDGFASTEELGGRFRVVPLSGTPLFESAFMRNISFPEATS